VFVLSAFAAWRDVRAAQNELSGVRRTLSAIVKDPALLKTKDGRAEAVRRLDDADAEVAAARRRVSRSLPLSVIRYVPVLRRQRQGIVGFAEDAHTGIGIGRDLFTRVERLAEENQVSGGRVPLGAVAELQHELRRAGTRSSRLVRSAGGLWGALGRGRRDFNRIASESSSRLLHGSEAAGAMRGVLGGDGDRRYLVAVQNNAEMRDQGMPLSYAVARLSGGHLTVEHTGHISELLLHAPAPTPIPPGTETVFGSILPTTLWQSVNATADSAWSSRAMLDMYAQATGEHLDGVVALDVPAISALLRVVGPVTVPGIEGQITADNAAQILLNQLYNGIPAGAAPPATQDKEERQAEVARALVDRMAAARVDPLSLGLELAASAAGGHLRFYSVLPGEEGVVERTGLGGPPGDGAPRSTFHVAVENRTATKLDYFIHPRISQQIRLNGRGDAVVRTTVTVKNDVPPGQPPSYQLGPDQFTQHPGDYIGWVLLWGPAGADQPNATRESGLALTPNVVAVSAGQVKEVTVETVILGAVHDGVLSLRLVPQPRQEAMPVEARLSAPGWHVREATRMAGFLDRLTVFSWHVSH